MALTYAKAGVSITQGDRLVDEIMPMARKTKRPEILNSIGGFAALSKVPKKYKNPIMVVSTDGIGTKLLLAKDLKTYTTIGIDLVAMSVNDILTVGAEPLLFLDYFATGKLNVRQGRDLIWGVAQGCKQSGCALVGGETAEMPKLYRRGDFDLAGFCVGFVEKSKIIDGSRVREGDSIVGLPSSGVHSNGYSLVRAILKKRNLGRSFKEELLRPTRIYVKEVLKFIENTEVHAMSHITGGGLEGNVPRVIPKGLHAMIDRSRWKVPNLFRLLQAHGGVREAEMFRTFNMGIGFVVVLARKDASKALKFFNGSKIIGKVVRGKGDPKVLWA